MPKNGDEKKWKFRKQKRSILSTLTSKNGTPYVIDRFFDVNQAKLRLYDIIELDKERRFKYYVDNDFFDNKYSLESANRYYCIKFRQNMPYEKYYEFENREIDVNEKRRKELQKKYEKIKKHEAEKIIPFYTI